MSISKVFALLAAPEEVAVEVVENNDISEMTVRELKEDLSKRSAATILISTIIRSIPSAMDLVIPLSNMAHYSSMPTA